MSFETFALIWPFLSVSFAVGTVLLYIRLEERFTRGR
jgi:hypothetical protein